MPDTDATLIVLGGLFQLAGVGFVFQEVRMVRNRVNAYRCRPQTMFGTALAVDVRDSASMSATSSPAPPLTLEQRLDALDAHVANLPEQWRQDDERVAQIAANTTSSAVKSVASSSRKDVDDLAALVLDLRPRNTWWNPPCCRRLVYRDRSSFGDNRFGAVLN